ncbi:hypothetical protein [Deinococcus yavapaiensis]|uniref:hypothetical protein n=1 Tax=Deinococcus yavapaiensis TaxID=309889 RepID=UPI000DA226CE|nr:hypothetical protein [Deinococcus yavapaiensis]
MLLLPLALLLGSCRYTSFPLVPPVLQGDVPARLSAASLQRVGDALELRLVLDARSGSGFFDVAWFDGDALLARDRTYVDASDPNAVFRLSATPGGEFRALVSFEGTLLRQFELTEAAP